MSSVDVRVERVRAPHGTPDDLLDAPADHGRLAFERALLDIEAGGRRIVAPHTSYLDQERARRHRLWAERGEFQHVKAEEMDGKPASELIKDPLDALRKAYRPESEPCKDAPEPAAPSRPGTITESEFVPLRDRLVHQLEVSLFHAEQAQNMLGMLIQNTRTDASSVLAAQSEYFLDPHALSLSALEKALPDEEEKEDAAPRLGVAEQKLVLEEKHTSLRTAAGILARGADEIAACLPSERERWMGLQRIQQRGWKLTPGRPLVDMERFDTIQSKDKLQGFGVPIVHGNGSVKEEGARDAWIGYGPSEAPNTVLQRTLAYWADTGKNALAFPDRGWRQMQVEFHDASGGCVWVSERSGGGGDDLDAQLYDAQLEAVDAELFRELTAQSGTLMPVLARTITENCLSLPLSSQLELRFVLAPKSASDTHRVSPWATLLLHVLRLRMLRGWTVKLSELQHTRASSLVRTPAQRYSIVAPLWELYEYTLFLSRLRALLDKCVEAFDKAHVEWQPYGAMHDARAWLAAFLDVASNDADDAPPVTCSGGAWIYHGAAMVAHLSLRAPSYVVASFPLHLTPNGAGVRLPVELESLAPLLHSELAAHSSKSLHNS